MADLISQIQSLLTTAKTYKPTPSHPDRLTRLTMLAQVQALHYALEDPLEAMFHQLTNYSETSAIRTLRQMGVLEKIPRDGMVNVADLALVVHANEEVLNRLMRILAATGILRAGGGGVYSHTPLSLAYLDTPEVEFWDLCVDEIAPVAYRIPEYISTHVPSSILNPRQSPYSWAANAEGKTFYEVLLDHPARLRRFNTAMTTQENALPVLGMFPFADLLRPGVVADGGVLVEAGGGDYREGVEGEGEERVSIVDVAGGRGQSLTQIKLEIEKAGGLGLGRCVLQDRKAVLDAIPEGELEGVEKMEIDFFDSQPVKNARIYYLRRIMHNWQDAECHTILQHIADAMAADSRLLIAEMVVPDIPHGVDKTAYWMDMCMLIIGGKERSEKEFEVLLEGVGLRLAKIWWSKAGSQTVLECRLR